MLVRARASLFEGRRATDAGMAMSWWSESRLTRLDSVEVRGGDGASAVERAGAAGGHGEREVVAGAALEVPAGVSQPARRHVGERYLDDVVAVAAGLDCYGSDSLSRGEPVVG